MMFALAAAPCCSRGPAPGRKRGDAVPGSQDTPGAVAQIVAIGKALSDPIRVRMLEMMARGRGCCRLPGDAPAAATDEGICVCEFTLYFQLGQSRVSYHLKVLKDAGLVLETTRGKWSFYALNRKVLRRLADGLNEMAGGAAPGSEAAETQEKQEVESDG